MRTHYTAIIESMVPGYDPRHIEAYMRIQYSTLDHLDRATFRREAKIAAACIDEGGVEMAEATAKSYGL